MLIRAGDGSSHTRKAFSTDKLLVALNYGPSSGRWTLAVSWGHDKAREKIHVEAFCHSDK